MELWILFLILAGMCLLIGIFLSARQKSVYHPSISSAIQPYRDPQNESELDIPPNFSEPGRWDEAEIYGQFQDLRNAGPEVISHLVGEIKKRFVITASDRTAKVRIEFVRTVLERLNLEKQCAEVVQDLKAMSREYELRLKRLELQALEIERDHRKVCFDIKSQTAIGELTLQRDIATLKREIARIEDETERIKNPPKAESPVTPEQQRAKDKAACEAKIASLKQEKQDALKLADETDRALRVNALDDALQREYERWAKLLV